MRLITTKDTNNPPDSLVNGKAEQVRIALTQDLASISEDIYKGDKITINDVNDPYHGEEEYEVRYQLRRLFHNKCAYCECIEYKPDVEHFRPKKGVSGHQRNKHGYYWLCYEWTNLLPVCSACNSKSGKWNKFPIAGTRITNPPLTVSKQLDFDKCKVMSSYLQSEVPLLLHPEIDEPTNFFKLEWNGKLTAIDDINRKGEISIDTYNLNRGNLTKARKEVIDNAYSFIRLLFNAFRDGIIEATGLQELLITYLETFKAKSDIVYPYSFVRLYITQHFSDFVEDNFIHFSEIEKQLLKESFPVEA